jgi:23S rRNA (guanosine2251-2'-O)-methyltransferase
MSQKPKPKSKKTKVRRVRYGRGDQRQESKTISSSPAANLWLYGHHAVHAALTNPTRRIERLLATPEALNRLPTEVVMGLNFEIVEKVSRTDIDAVLGPDTVHQGLALKTAPLSAMDITDALDGLGDSDPALVVALDQVTDPHNVGAVLRSAAAFGARAVLTTRHNAPDETGVLAKSASGALETIPLLRVTNMSRALGECKDFGFWIVGLDAGAETDIDLLDTPARCVLVLGAEGDGLRPGVRQNCDFMARLPMTTEAMESLNVSNAAAISMYEWRRQRRN